MKRIDSNQLWRAGRIHGLALAVLLVLLGPVGAGEVVTFKAGKARVALPDIEVKGVVAEFLDPEDTGLGKSIAYLVWREILTAISDQHGAGVVLARAPAGQRLTDMLESDYHVAAINVARHQEAQMVLWGVVYRDTGALARSGAVAYGLTPEPFIPVAAFGERVSVESYISLLPELRDGQLSTHLDMSWTGGIRGLESELVRTRFNFAVHQTTEDRLFRRRVVTRVDAVLRAGPDAAATALDTVPSARVLQSVGMHGAWFEVQLPSGERAYVHNGSVDVPPRTVEGHRTGVNFRSGPGEDHSILREIDIEGIYEVLDMRYRSGRGLWYKLRVDGTVGWLAAFLVRPRLSLPVIHFQAGVYRYLLGRYRDAGQEFDAYIDAVAMAHDKAALASAHQLRGASILSTAASLESRRSALRSFSSAIELTPYDPNAYRFRALASLASGRGIRLALKDVERALELDRFDGRSRSLLYGFEELVRDQQILQRVDPEAASNYGSTLAVVEAVRRRFATN